jgi:hypothetical protein
MNTVRKKSVARAASKRNLRKEELEVSHQLQEFHQRWHRDNEIIRKVFELAEELVHVPQLLDVYCSSRFTRDEIISSTMDDALAWLAAGADSDEEENADIDTVKVGVAA